MKKIKVLIRSIEELRNDAGEVVRHAGEEVLGVLSEADYQTLCTDGDAMPCESAVYDVDAIETASGGFAFVRKSRLIEVGSGFTLADHDAKQSAKDAAIAGLDPTMRDSLFPGHVPESVKRSRRSQARAEAQAREEAKAAADTKAAADAEAVMEARIQAAAERLLAKAKP